MLRVQFNDSKVMIEAEFKILSAYIVQLTGPKVEANTSGFTTYRLNGDFLGDYSEYTNVIKEEEGSVQLGKITEDNLQEVLKESEGYDEWDNIW